MDEKEAFAAALKLEEEGRDNYLNEAENSGNFVIKEVFTYLAGEELKHIESIKKISESLDMDVEFTENPLDKAQKMFTELVKDLKAENLEKAEFTDAYTSAETFEKKTYEFYRKRVAEAASENLRKFFEALAEQENAHFTMLEQLRVWSDNPTAWGEHTEGWFYKLD